MPLRNTCTCAHVQIAITWLVVIAICSHFERTLLTICSHFARDKIVIIDDREQWSREFLTIKNILLRCTSSTWFFKYWQTFCPVCRHYVHFHFNNCLYRSCCPWLAMKRRQRSVQMKDTLPVLCSLCLQFRRLLNFKKFQFILLFRLHYIVIARSSQTQEKKSTSRWHFAK